MKKPTIWFLTRSFPPFGEGGGAMARAMQVEFLRRHFPIEVVSMKQGGRSIETRGSACFIPRRVPRRAGLLLEHLGLVGDALFDWVQSAFAYLEKRVHPGDILFSTSGGELAAIELGAKLKRAIPGTFHIANYHDLLDYGKYDGERLFSRPHAPVDHLERRYLEEADAVIAIAEIARQMLIRKFPRIANRVHTVYLGYPAAYSPKQGRASDGSPGDALKIRIGYAGSMSQVQAPEILIKAWRQLAAPIRDRFELTFVGNTVENPYIHSANDVRKVANMPRQDLAKMFSTEMDVGFLSLIDKKAFRPLMSTKFLEYIGLELPILACIPSDCEAGRIIEHEGFGLVSTYGDIPTLQRHLTAIANTPSLLSTYRANLSQQKHLFCSETTLPHTISIIESVIMQGSQVINQ